MNDKIYFFHGLESGPHGRKYHGLSEHFDVESPDFQGMHIDERLAKADALTEGMSDLIVVGSSYGGLLAALLYSRRPERFFGYVLAAPALHRDLAEEEITQMPPNAVIVHGVHDDVVPLAPVKAFCAEYGLDVLEVDDDHPLANSIDVLVEKVGQLVQARASQ